MQVESYLLGAGLTRYRKSPQIGLHVERPEAVIPTVTILSSIRTYLFHETFPASLSHHWRRFGDLEARSILVIMSGISRQSKAVEVSLEEAAPYYATASCPESDYRLYSTGCSSILM